jgi:O-antigen/teichoic acid export membrane protein
MSVIRKNIAWLFVSQVLTWVMTLVVLTQIPDHLGDEGYGTFAYVVGYIGFFTLIVGLGSSTYLAREIARDHSVAGPYVFNAVLMKFVLVVVFSAVALGLAVMLGDRGETLLLMAIGCIGMLFQALNEVFGGSLAGMERLAKPAMWMVVQVYVQAILGLYLVVVLGLGVVAYGTVMSLAVVVPMVACGVMLWPRIRGHMRLDLGVWRKLVVGGIPLLALTVFNLIYGTVDIPILKQMAGTRDVGWYAVALRWAGLPIFVATAVMSAYFPSFSAHGNPVTPQYAPLVNRATRLVSLATIPAAVGLALISSDLFHLVYNHKYDDAIPAMVILCFSIPLIAIDSVLASALIAAERMNRYIAVSVIAAVINPIGCIVLINVTLDRYDNGAIGTAIMTVATELIVLVGALKFRLPGVLDRATVSSLARTVLASLVMVPVVVAANDLPVPVQIVLGAITYAVAAIVLGALTRDEVRAGTRQVSAIIGRFNPRRKEPPAGPDGSNVQEKGAATPGDDATLPSEL